MDLSILIATIPNREKELNLLTSELINQIIKAEAIHRIEIIIEKDNGVLSIGEKRNILVNKSKGKYICFIDDDDFISNDYINLILEGISKDVDCCSLRGVMTWNGNLPQIFEHSIKYHAYTTNYANAIVYERYPNHLNVIKKEIAEQFKFPNKRSGEDTDWAGEVYLSGLIKTEHFIEQVIYHYLYKSK